MERFSLLFFTRYPRAGEVKTRLHPALGPAGAALVHRALSERALLAARRFTAFPGRRLKVYGSGADFREMGRWLGFDLVYRRQADGDLGRRLAAALRAELANGAEAAIVIGSDCPELTAAILEKAAAELAAGADLVLGPARDGGYYLLGLRQPRDGLFQDIPWGGAEVAARTLARAAAENLRVRLLPLLADVDRPADLALWQRLARPRISVVIPVLDEASILPATLAALQLEKCPGVVEVLVVDGGSRDQSAELAAVAGGRVLHSAPGRGRQLNAGARAARGAVLFFLHADTRIEISAYDEILSRLRRPGVVLGAFSLAIAAPGLRFRLLEKMIALRCRWLRLPYGDQGFFIRREDFFTCGGFREIPLLEDLDFLRRARRRGRLALSRQTVLTSARRWQRRGFWRTTLLNQLILLGAFLGLPPSWLKKLYR
ncbi:MAG: TIGR04283 family arsenosugar biosynthesis glycosyltransferase [Deltaproteobacteria bacterium]|nr:TIGR04283 family arsenosugar biosynthesis glycosyltransferase [Deltaproteobacteria bacterium]